MLRLAHLKILYFVQENCFHCCLHTKMHSRQSLSINQFIWLRNTHVCKILFASFVFLYIRSSELCSGTCIFIYINMSDNICLYIAAEAPVRIETSGTATSIGRRARGRMRPQAYRPLCLHTELYESCSYLTFTNFWSGNNSSCALETSDPSTSRDKRRRLLKQHRLVWGGIETYFIEPLYLWPCKISLPQRHSPWAGAASIHSANLECGQFDEDFVEALKGKAATSLHYIYLYLYYGTQPTKGVHRTH